MAATKRSTSPNTSFTDLDFIFRAISREPAWLPRKTATTQRVQINQSGRAAVNMWEIKLDAPENVTIIAEVAAATFGAKPAM